MKLIKATRTSLHELLSEDFSEIREPVEGLIGNINTGKVHEPGCNAIWMMLSEHKVPTNGEGFEPCGWCKGGSVRNKLRISNELKKAK